MHKQFPPSPLTRLPVSLAPGQVHQVELGLPEVDLSGGVVVDDLEPHGEDGVRPGRVLVHGGGGGDPRLDPLPEELSAVTDGLDLVHGEVCERREKETLVKDRSAVKSLLLLSNERRNLEQTYYRSRERENFLLH